MAVLLPIPSSSLPDEEQRADLKRRGSHAFFGLAEGLFGALGLDTAAGNLRRYRGARGGSRAYTDKEIEEHPLVTEAEDTNRTKFTAQTLTGKSKNVSNNNKLLNLRNGDEFRFKDYWEARGKLDGISPKLRNLDTFLSFGSFDVRSTGDLTARRKGDRLHVTGTVRHGFDEETEEEKQKREAQGNYQKREENLYDFNEGALGGGAARDLEPAGATKPFRMQFDRNQDLEAELEYQPDGRLLLRRAKWGAIR